ncbi:MAG: arylesterase [Gammaproteobacteria bacterium]|nr:arylesterase [Gammaproteobacteria bacterium]
MPARSFQILILVFGLLLYAAAPAAAPRTLVVLGDSLSSAYGMDVSQGWVRLLAKRLQREGYDWRVVNASVSGETTGGGLTRLQSLLATQNPDLVIIALGGNDGLRGLPIEQMQANLLAMVDAARAARVNVLLAGLRMPPNYGPAYARRFEEAFREVARQRGIPLVPYLLRGVDDNAALMQDDRIHAAPAAQPAMLDNVWSVLLPLLR